MLKISQNKKKLFSLICLLLIYFTTILVIRAKPYRGIIPLKSNRSDVEKKFGKSNESGYYKIGRETVQFYYLENSCKEKTTCECAVNVNTVLQISVNIHYKLKLKQLNLNRKKFTKTISLHLPNRVTYADFKEGIVYEIDNDNNLVVSISYLPSESDCKELITNPELPNLIVPKRGKK